MSGSKVRVRSTLMRTWVWELVTSDGHVAAASEDFGDRAACEAEALRQGLPVSGIRKSAVVKKKALAPGRLIASDSRGVWHWKHIDEHGEVVASSAVGFLTKPECERDAAARAGAAP